MLKANDKITSIFHLRNILPEEGTSLYVTMCSNRSAGGKGGRGNGSVKYVKKNTKNGIQ